MAHHGAGMMGGHPGFELKEGEQPLRSANVRRVLRLFLPHKRKVAGATVLVLITALLGVVNPLMQVRIFDDIFTPAVAGRQVHGVFGLSGLKLLILYVGIMVVVPTVSSLVGILQTYITTVIGQGVIQDLRNRLYRHLQAMALKFFTDTRTGEIQARLSSDVAGVQTVVTDTFTSIVANIAILLTTVIAMWLLSPALTVLSLCLVPLFIYLTTKVGNVRREIATQTQKTVADLSALVEETLSVNGVLLSKTFGRQKASTARFERENSRLARLFIRQQMVGRSFMALIGTFFSISPALVYLLAGYLLFGNHGRPVSMPLIGTLSVGTLVGFTTLQSRLFFPIGQMLQVQIEVTGAFALFDRVFEYLDMSHDITDKPGAVALRPEEVDGEVEFRDVSFSYIGKGGAQALSDVSFRAGAGQLVALVGPSGAGKTTTTYMIPRFYDVDQGAVLIDGHDVRDLQLESLGELIGVVTQETYLFHDTIRENLLFAKPDATDEELMTAIEVSAIGDRVRELPAGLDTVVGERGYRMSGGEKQRLAIARVFLKDPRILILDEATSALDTHSERLIQAAFAKLMQGRTTVAIAHRLSTILRADQILVMDHGKVVEQGTHSQLVNQGGLYSRLYLEQFASDTDSLEVVPAPEPRLAVVTD
ncbi:MAG TPA: ABC transporter ATP-binding protein [Candidatus Solibacter sp.]|jgi:ATP-binding cassette subfamily B protein|nr:ABC transporter ATP-binding protein [Candidatus Solibacter sp.]